MTRTVVGTGRQDLSSGSVDLNDAFVNARLGLGGEPEKLVLVFSTPSVPLAEVMRNARKLANAQAVVVGCTTAGEIQGNALTHSSVVITLIGGSGVHITAKAATDLSNDPESAVATLVDGLETHRQAARQAGLEESLALILLDGLSGQGELLVHELRKVLGPMTPVVGGAAGDEAKLERTWVGIDQHAYTDAAVVVHVFSKRPWGIGVDHGLKPTSDLYEVKRAEGAVVYELNSRPIYDVYDEYAKSRGVTLNSDNISTFLINNELGVYVLGQFRNARAPLFVKDDNGFVCAAPVNQGSHVAIMGGEKDDLVSAAGNAALESKQRVNGTIAGVLLFDCVCRGGILGNDFPWEIDAVRKIIPEVPLAGFLTYGEIARYSGRMDGWHNTTAVVCTIPA